MRPLVIALPLLAACAPVAAPDGSAPVTPPTIAIPDTAQRCAAYTLALNLTASLWGINEAERRRGDTALMLGTVAGCSGEAWEAAQAAWAGAVAR